MGGTAGTYGYKSFSEVTGKLAHIFQYAMNSTIGPDACAPLVEFIYEAIAVLESDLLMISANGVEAEDDVKAFKQRYPFAFQQPVDEPEEQAVMTRPLPPEEQAVMTRPLPPEEQAVMTRPLPPEEDRSTIAPPVDTAGAQEPAPIASPSEFQSESYSAPLAEEPLAAQAASLPLPEDAPLPGEAETTAENPQTDAAASPVEAFEASGPDEEIEPGVTTEEPLAPKPLPEVEKPLPLEPVALEHAKRL